MQSQNELQVLLKAVMAGDMVAQGEFCKRFEVNLRRMLATSFTAGGAVGHSDITQSVFRRFFEALKHEKLSISQPHEIMALLIRYARNRRVDAIRKQIVREEHYDRLQRFLLSRQDSESIADKAEKAELIDSLRSHLSTLSVQEQQIFDLRVNAGMTFCEIGSDQGMTTSAAQKMFHRVVEKLRLKLLDSQA